MSPDSEMTDYWMKEEGNIMIKQLQLNYLFDCKIEIHITSLTHVYTHATVQKSGAQKCIYFDK